MRYQTPPELLPTLVNFWPFRTSDAVSPPIGTSTADACSVSEKILNFAMFTFSVRRKPGDISDLRDEPCSSTAGSTQLNSFNFAHEIRYSREAGHFLPTPG